MEEAGFELCNYHSPEYRDCRHHLANYENITEFFLDGLLECYIYKTKMRLIAILLSLSFTAFSLGGDVSTRMDSVTFTGVLEKFYADLAQRNTAALSPLILHYRSLKAENAMVFGEALARCKDGPVAVTEMPTLIIGTDMEAQFKEMTGLDLVEFKVFIVRYPCSERIRSAYAERGYQPISKLYQFEDAFCDLWLYGSDGKWRVACDLRPFFRIDRQSLGLQLSEDKAYALKRQKSIDEEKLRFEETLLDSNLPSSK